MHLSQLCSRSFGMGVGLFIKSLNKTLYQIWEKWFHGEIVIAWGGGGEHFSWGKFEWKTPIIGVTFLVKKKTVQIHDFDFHGFSRYSGEAFAGIKTNLH